MKIKLLIIAILCFISSSAQVSQIWTDYNTFWTSSSSSINPVKPNTAHNLLAFRWNNGTTTNNTTANKIAITVMNVSLILTSFFIFAFTYIC